MSKNVPEIFLKKDDVFSDLIKIVILDTAKADAMVKESSQTGWDENNDR
jgi:hypothetical protein